MCNNKPLKKCVNLKNCVIIGPLWVKYEGKTAYQPPAAQNPGHAPDYRFFVIYLGIFGEFCVFLGSFYFFINKNTILIITN